ncbi:hypothetical protein [Tychonema sp. LEGE 06208]|uniref:hypothetical protein n=1 Tax=Tychonema sp. LEGE 06208 TaxID=1828663 RepID=UPI00187ECA37|nr:hypothetical protein [Tychonema sp. LEGE 06208]MBE9164980.1 hypothetical protein [Tychonema sp. LEGE 06208]
MAGAGLRAGISDVVSVTSAGAGFWAGISDVVSVTSAGAGFGAEIADVVSAISAGAWLAGVSAKFNESFGEFAAVNAAVSG